MSTYSPNSNAKYMMKTNSQAEFASNSGYQQPQFGVQSQYNHGGSLQHDLDPYAPAIVQDLLHGSNEWKNIQDIVKLTFKAVCDVVRSQGLAIRELERVLPTKANKSELNAGLSLKANVSDVSRTIAEVASAVESKLTFEEVQGLLDEKVAKTDLQYLLSNKISVEEMQKVLENKANLHEINMEFQTLSSKLEEMYRDTSKRLSNCALQKDFNYLTSMLETKANIDDVNESLQNKANKQSVANALHRKANRSDMDQILETKADATDIEKICNILENKAESSQIEHFTRLLEAKIDKQELYSIKQDLVSKADKQDIDMYVMAVQNQKLELEQRQKANEKDLDDFIGGIQRELESIKATMLQSLNKKADYSLLDTMKDSLHKKVDHEYLQTVINKIKSDNSAQITQQQNDLMYNRKHKDDKQDERVAKVEMNSERALDEIFFVKDQLKHLQDERKKDVEETADFIKSIINNGKMEQQKDLQRVSSDVDNVRKLLADKCSVNELLETKSKIYSTLENKVELKEVQSALNECQNEICEQLADFKKVVKNDIHQIESELFKMMERKANVLDVQDALSHKVDLREITNLPQRSEVQELVYKLDRITEDINTKLDQRDFDEFDEILRKKIEELQNHLLQKSNIKDVCALLDMKSNIDDVNKALGGMHDEMQVKVSDHQLREALTEQNTINEALCAENCVARWLWKSGELHNGYAVPWEMQSVNTCPENFLWEEDKTTVLTVAPGLYEITFGFFCNKKPTIQLLVNGEAVLSAVNSSSYVIHHSSGKLKSLGKHSSGNLTGLTLVDFIALPARARLSISYSGENGAEGFLGLRKL